MEAFVHGNTALVMPLLLLITNLANTDDIFLITPPHNVFHPMPDILSFDVSQTNWNRHSKSNVIPLRPRRI